LVEKRKAWTSWLLAGTAVIAWLLANGLDVLSVLFVVRFGGIFALARHRPAEFLVIYAGMRLLGTLAVFLLAAFVGKRWPFMSMSVWSALTAGALVTAIAAWWRLYR
jgi:hypothetical protein